MERFETAGRRRGWGGVWLCDICHMYVFLFHALQKLYNFNAHNVTAGQGCVGFFGTDRLGFSSLSSLHFVALLAKCVSS